MSRALMVLSGAVVTSTVVQPVTPARMVAGSPGAMAVGDRSRLVVCALRLRAPSAHGTGDDCGHRVGHLRGGHVVRAGPMGVPRASEHTLEPSESHKQDKHEARPAPIG
jgi:hypothetical protein